MSFKVLEPHAGTNHVDAGHLRFQHQVIDVALRLRELTVDRKRARNVRSVTFVFSAGIHQQQIAILKRVHVGDIVQHGGVCA